MGGELVWVEGGCVGCVDCVGCRGGLVVDGVEGVVLVGDVVAASGVGDFAGFDHASEEEAHGVVGEIGALSDFCRS